jgi:hypothetical protein
VKQARGPPARATRVPRPSPATAAPTITPPAASSRLLRHELTVTHARPGSAPRASRTAISCSRRRAALQEAGWRRWSRQFSMTKASLGCRA